MKSEKFWKDNCRDNEQVTLKQTCKPLRGTPCKYIDTCLKINQIHAFIFAMLFKREKRYVQNVFEASSTLKVINLTPFT